MQSLVLLGASALISLASPALAEIPTKGNLYSIEFLEGKGPTVSEQPHAGRYCGKVAKKGETLAAVIVFKLKRDKTFNDIAESERGDTVCNSSMEAFYRQAKDGLETAALERYPMPRHIMPHIPRIPRYYPRMHRDIKLPPGFPIKK